MMPRNAQAVLISGAKLAKALIPAISSVKMNVELTLTPDG